MKYKVEYEIVKYNKVIMIVDTGDTILSFTLVHGVEDIVRCENYYIRLNGHTIEEAIVSYIDNKDIDEETYWNHD